MAFTECFDGGFGRRGVPRGDRVDRGGEFGEGIGRAVGFGDPFFERLGFVSELVVGDEAEVEWYMKRKTKCTWV